MATFDVGPFTWTLDDDGGLEQVAFRDVPLFSRGTHPRVITLAAANKLFRVNEFTSSWEQQEDGTVQGVHEAPASFETSEGDAVWYAMQVLAAFEHGGRWRPAVAVHPERNLAYFGPMGITRALNGELGDGEKIRRLLFRLIEFGYSRASKEC